MGNESQALSMSSFKRADGSFKTTDEMSKEEKVSYHLAVGMKSIIELLELSIENDRIFSRTKYNVMKTFHAMRDELLLS